VSQFFVNFLSSFGVGTCIFSLLYSYKATGFFNEGIQISWILARERGEKWGVGKSILY